MFTENLDMGINSSGTRAIRSPKTKLFLYICAVLVITGLIACYNSTLTQLEEVKKSQAVCGQQQENLSMQLQVISDYKQKLEKSLKNERAEHQQTKNDWEMKINEEKIRNEKESKDALMKYNSLQQHFKLLQTEFDDFKEESGNTQKKQLEEINSLQAKLKEVEEELKKVVASKESIKTQYTEVELENIQLKKDLQKTGKNESQQQIKFYSEQYRILEEKYETLKQKCGEPVGDSANKPSEIAAVNLPAVKLAENPSSSTKALPKISPSEGVLNGVPPLNVPSVTPESAKKVNLKPPQGVVDPPDNQNEQPQLESQKRDDPDKDNGAQEILDEPQEGQGIAFADEGLKLGLNNFDQKRNEIDNKKHDDQDYKREDEGDDDIDDYGQARGEEVAVRN
ncbi:hypothetical protein ABEB36_012086 [Hypothenemus hampei]|uniref:Golgi membrane protein 1 n=1 Tax=Hypothenemus hampei TaxID=57062 RepID=A0ABD1EA40_HYPHA